MTKHVRPHAFLNTCRRSQVLEDGSHSFILHHAEASPYLADPEREVGIVTLGMNLQPVDDCPATHVHQHASHPGFASHYEDCTMLVKLDIPYSDREEFSDPTSALIENKNQGLVP